MNTALAFDFLFLPVCATIAGFVIWVSSRDQSLSDGSLLRHFMFILAIFIVLAWGGSRTDTARLHLDPQFRLQTELDAHPVYSAIKRLKPDDHKILHDFLVLQISQERTVADAFLQARSLLTKLTKERFAWADQKTSLMWARVNVDTLRVLQPLDPLLCYRALSSQPLDQQTLAHAFSTDNTKAFQQSIIEVYESADRGVRNQRPSEESSDHSQAALEYGVIQEVIIQKFGKAVSKELTEHFTRALIAPPEQLCSARIFQLDTMLARPQAMASTLIRSVLR